MLSRLLFRLARRSLLDPAVRFGFAHLSALLPVRRVWETEQILAFHHPSPSWPFHVLFVPKVGIASFLDIRPEQVPLIGQLIELAMATASQSGAEAGSLALMVNGGTYQDVGQLHFHLVGPPHHLGYVCPEDPVIAPLIESETLIAFHHPRPQRATHVVLRPTARGSPLASDHGLDPAFIDDVITVAQDLVGMLRLDLAGYSLLTTVQPRRPAETACFHLVSGSELG
jgi:histidine triad (HIT) family protein